MSKMGDHRIEGYYDYVVPPLEGFWQQPGVDGFDCSRKSDFHWISVLRLPDFVTRADLEWAVTEAALKKKQDFSAVEYLTLRRAPRRPGKVAHSHQAPGRKALMPGVCRPV